MFAAFPNEEVSLILKLLKSCVCLSVSAPEKSVMLFSVSFFPSFFFFFFFFLGGGV